MPTSSFHPQPRIGGSTPTSSNPEWRCTRCDKLLGIGRDGRMHLRFARGHQYSVGFPVVATCRGCATLNQQSGPLAD